MKAPRVLYLDAFSEDEKRRICERIADNGASESPGAAPSQHLRESFGCADSERGGDGYFVRRCRRVCETCGAAWYQWTAARLEISILPCVRVRGCVFCDVDRAIADVDASTLAVAADLRLRKGQLTDEQIRHPRDAMLIAEIVQKLDVSDTSFGVVMSVGSCSERIRLSSNSQAWLKQNRRGR